MNNYAHHYKIVVMSKRLMWLFNHSGYKDQSSHTFYLQVLYIQLLNFVILLSLPDILEFHLTT